MNFENRAQDITGHLSGTTNDALKRANKVWDERTREEQQSLVALGIIFLFAGLLALVWNAARTGSGSGKYVEIHKSRKDEDL